MHTIPTSGFLPKALTVCAPGEKHEFWLLIITVFLKRKGNETDLFRGINRRIKIFFTVLNIIRPSYLFMSCSLNENLRGTLNLIENLNRDFPDLRVGLGGAALNHLSEDVQMKLSRVLIGDTLSDWEKWLKSEG